MRILGIGIDIIQNSRIQTILSRPSSHRFISKVLHEQEIKHFQTINLQKSRVQYLASRWAVKQAIVKAIGNRQILFHELNIAKDQNGRPYVVATSETNKKILENLKIDVVHVSLAHEDDYSTAQALAVTKQ